MRELKASLYDRATYQERMIHTVAPHVDVPAVFVGEKAVAHYTLVMLDNTKGVPDVAGCVPQEVILDTGAAKIMPCKSLLRHWGSICRHSRPDQSL